MFLSRSLHPAVGFALSFNFTFWQIFYVGLNGAFLSIYAIQPTIAAIGVQQQNQDILDVATWFGDGWGLFLSAGVAILAILALHLYGAGKYFKWQRIGSYIAVASLVVTLVVSFSPPPGSWTSRRTSTTWPDPVPTTVSSPAVRMPASPSARRSRCRRP